MQHAGASTETLPCPNPSKRNHHRRKSCPLSGCRVKPNRSNAAVTTAFASRSLARRTAAEGLIGVEVSGTKGAAVEVNSETDFVAKNEQFQTFVRDVTSVALELGDDLATIKATSLGEKTVEETLTNNIATIGENQNLRRAKRLEVSAGAVVPYIHNAQAPGLGKIGVLVAMTGGDEAFGKQVAMHIAATNPASLSEDDLDPAVVEKEKTVQMDIARESGKPEAVIEKMIVGRMKKFMAEVTLVNQQFVVNPDLTVGKAAEEAGATITGFVRLEVGEGIDKKEEDFAAEVAKAAGA